MDIAASEAADIKAFGSSQQSYIQNTALSDKGFYGNFSFVLDPDGYSVTVSEGFGFVDSNNIKWEAPRGFKSDGASIPRLFWGIIGGPLSSKYRIAAVLYDYYVTKKHSSAQETKSMFLEAMIASGVSESQASLLYSPVNSYGPRW